jgi:hypothetical protein
MIVTTKLRENNLYLFNRVLHDVSDCRNRARLADAVYSSHSLLFDRWIPLRFQHICARSSRQVDAVVDIRWAQLISMDPTYPTAPQDVVMSITLISGSCLYCSKIWARALDETLPSIRTYSTLAFRSAFPTMSKVVVQKENTTLQRQVSCIH